MHGADRARHGTVFLLLLMSFNPLFVPMNSRKSQGTRVSSSSNQYIRLSYLYGLPMQRFVTCACVH